MQNLLLFKPNGDAYRSFEDVSRPEISHEGALSFHYKCSPEDPRSVMKVVTNLPFVIESDGAVKYGD